MKIKLFNLALIILLLNFKLAYSMEAPHEEIKIDLSSEETIVTKLYDGLSQKEFNDVQKKVSLKLINKVAKASYLNPLSLIDKVLTPYGNLTEDLKKKLKDHALHCILAIIKMEIHILSEQAAREYDPDPQHFIPTIQRLHPGSDVEKKDEYGTTLLLFCSAIKFNSPKAHPELNTTRAKIIIMRILLDLGANINAQDNLGMTPLMYAAHFNDKATLGFLISHGANKEMTDYLHRTATEIALNFGNIEIANFIENYKQN